MLFYFCPMSSALLNIGLVQFDVSWERPDLNMQRIESLIADQVGFDLLLLPEMWSSGFTMTPETASEPAQGPALQWMVQKARQWDTAIAGSISVSDGPAYFNRFYCAWPDGRIAHYDKKHLFSFGKEDQHYTPGQTQVQLDIKGWKIRPIICYDLRFPVWCRNNDNYDMLLVVANWPIPRIHHWDALLRARAIENQCFVVAINRIGEDATGLQYNGHSSIYAMNGLDSLVMDDKESVGRLSLDKNELISYRNQFRFLQDRDTFTL